MSILRLDRAAREIGTFTLILDEIFATVGVGERIGPVSLKWRGKTTLLMDRCRAGRTGPRRGRRQACGPSLGLLAQSPIWTRRSWLRPTCERAVRNPGRRIWTSWPTSWRPGARLTGSRRAAFTRSCSTASKSSAGTPSTSASTPRCPDSGLHPDVWIDSRRPVAFRRRADPGRAWLGWSSRIRAAHARRADQPPRPRRARMARGAPPAAGRGSARGESHDRAFLDATVARVRELRDRSLTIFRGDYSQYHRQREERDARLEKDVETQTDSIARERELVQRYRSHRKFSKMHEHEARPRTPPGRAGRGAQGRQAASRSPRGR